MHRESVHEGVEYKWNVCDLKEIECMEVSSYNTMESAERINSWRYQIPMQWKMIKESIHKGIKFLCNGNCLKNHFMKVSRYKGVI